LEPPVPEKKTNRVSMFLGDADHERFLSDCYDEGREPADFLRWLWVEHRKAKVRAWAESIKRKEMELAGTGHSGVGADLRGVGRNVIERDSEWPDTVQTR
jgi:hypothetical protein